MPGGGAAVVEAVRHQLGNHTVHQALGLRIPGKGLGCRVYQRIQIRDLGNQVTGTVNCRNCKSCRKDTDLSAGSIAFCDLLERRRFRQKIRQVQQDVLFQVTFRGHPVQPQNIRSGTRQDLRVQRPQGIRFRHTVLTGQANFQRHIGLRMGLPESGNDLPQIVVLIKAIDLQLLGGLQRCIGIKDIPAQHGAAVLLPQYVKHAVFRALQNRRLKTGVSQRAPVGTDQLFRNAAPGHKAEQALIGGEEQIARLILPEAAAAGGSGGDLGRCHQLLSQHICQ